MMTKLCLNTKCPAYAHFVYTLAMRCVLCRCDLIAAHRNADAGVVPAKGPLVSREYREGPVQPRR